MKRKERGKWWEVLVGIFILIVFIGLIVYKPSPYRENPSAPMDQTDKNFEVLTFIPYWIHPIQIPTGADYVALFALIPEKGGWKPLIKEIPKVQENTKLLWTLKIHSEDEKDWLESDQTMANMVESLEPYMKNSDGIVINMEDWTKYLKLEKLVSAIKERYPHKLLMVTLPSWGLPVSGNLGNMVDRFIVMAYDYNYKGGVLAPLPAVENTIRFYKPIASKTLLGIPLYGYLRKNGSVSAIQIKILESGSRTYTDEGEALSSYKGGTAVWNDKNTIQMKIDLAKKYGLRGIALWALGYSSQDFIENIINMAKESGK